MTERPKNDDLGSTRRQTGYEPHGRPETTHGFVRSAWSLVAAIILLLLVMAAVWTYWPEGHTNPAPAGSPGNVVPTAPNPGQSIK